MISFLGIAGVFMLAAAIIQGIYQNDMTGVLQELIGGIKDGSGQSSSMSIFTGTYFLVALFAWVNIVAMKVAIIAYVKVYERNDGETPAMPEVWDEFKTYFFKLLIFSIPIVLLIGLGFVFCLVPGVYFWVVLMPFEIVLMVEGKGFSAAFSRCYVIIKNNFWQSFGIYIIAYLIYSFSSGIIGLIVGVIAGAISYFTTNDLGSTIGLVTSILNIFSFVFYIIFFISAILHYYSLTEQYDGTGMLKRLDSLGGNSSFNNIEEQY